MITDEEKELFIDQLEGAVGNRPLFYLKFCAEEKYAEDVCKGDLYANTPKWFREKEMRSGERGQGDALELIQVFHAANAWFEDNDTGELFMSVPGKDWMLRFGSDDDTPIVSFVGIPIKEMNLLSFNEKRARFAFPFSEKEYEAMEEIFGKYCVIIGAGELEKNLSRFHREYDIDYIFDAIKYCPQNNLNRMLEFSRGGAERYLYKNEDLSYQREYRYVPWMEMPEDHFIKIGKLESAKTVLSSHLKDMVFCLEYKTSTKK